MEVAGWFIGAGIGTVFTVLYEGVKQLVGRPTKFKAQLEALELTLESFDLEVLQQIGRHNEAMGLRNEDVRALEQELNKGVRIIGELSDACLWNRIEPRYMSQLVELNRSLNILERRLKLQSMRDVKETRHMMQILLLGLTLHQEPGRDAYMSLLSTTRLLDMPPQEALHHIHTLDLDPLRNIASSSTSLQQYHGNGEIQGNFPTTGLPPQEAVHHTVALDPLRNIASTSTDLRRFHGCVVIISGEAIALAFGALCDSVKQVKDQIFMSKSQLGDQMGDIKSILDSLQPLIKEMAECEKEMDGPKEELENLRVEMEGGAELIRKCSKASAIQKYRYSSRLVELSKSLQRLLGILKVQGIRDVKKALATVRIIENVVQRIEGNCVTENNQSDKIQGWCAVPERPVITVGLDVPLRELKMKLFTDGVSMVILTAPGGCGKTTLATKLCQDAEIKDNFKSNIFFVTVTKKANLFLIVQELYHRTGAKVPDFQSEVSAVSWLHQFLKQTGQNPMLLVLDDVWTGSEFILEKFDELKMTNFKILVTSRFSFPRFGSPYYLECLNDASAMARFNHAASLGDRSSHISEDLLRKIALTNTDLRQFHGSGETFL